MFRLFSRLRPPLPINSIVIRPTYRFVNKELLYTCSSRFFSMVMSLSPVQTLVTRINMKYIESKHEAYPGHCGSAIEVKGNNPMYSSAELIFGLK